MTAAASREIKLAIVGATGTVGSQIADLIGARDFPFGELQLFGSEAGTTSEGVESGGRVLSVARLSSPADLAGYGIAFLAVPAADASAIIEANPGPVLIDLSAASRLPDARVPLVAPGLTARDRLLEMASNRLFAVPDPAAQAIATLLAAIDRRVGFAGAVVLQGASTGGRDAVSDLFNQSADLLNARLETEDDETQVAFNVFQPAGSNESSQVIAAQVAVLTPGTPAVVVDVVRVPTFHGCGVALMLSADEHEAREWPAKLRSAPGIVMVQGADASSFVDAVGQEAMLVRASPSPRGISLWCVYDGARLAALSAVWLAETLASTIS